MPSGTSSRSATSSSASTRLKDRTSVVGFLPARARSSLRLVELQRPAQLGLDHASADATPAHHEALVDEVLHRPAHGGTREAEGRGEVDLVLEQRPRREARRSGSHPRGAARPGSTRARGCSGRRRDGGSRQDPEFSRTYRQYVRSNCQMVILRILAASCASVVPQSVFRASSPCFLIAGAAWPSPRRTRARALRTVAAASDRPAGSPIPRRVAVRAPTSGRG